MYSALVNEQEFQNHPGDGTPVQPVQTVVHVEEPQTETLRQVQVPILGQAPQNASTTQTLGGVFVRERPDARCPFLRVQVGRWEKRHGFDPEYTPSGAYTGLRCQSRLDAIFHLLGFGETRQQAEAIAATYQKK